MTQFETFQRYIAASIAKGAKLACGGVGRPDGFPQGYFVKPNVFADVSPDMKIARVLAVIPYQTEERALEIANDSIYGLQHSSFKKASKHLLVSQPALSTTRAR